MNFELSADTNHSTWIVPRTIAESKSFMFSLLILLNLSFASSQKISDSGIGSQRKEQVLEPCAAPSEGCGSGLWSNPVCKCLCVTNYCRDTATGACTAWGSCGNDFLGCTPQKNCPYYPNTALGHCESGDEVPAGIFEVFYSEMECCKKHYSWDLEACNKETSPPTGRPTAPPTLSPTDAYTAAPQQDTGVLLPQIPMRLINVPDMQMSNVLSSKLEDVIRLICDESISSLGATILSVDIIGGASSPGRMLLRRGLNPNNTLDATNVRERNLAELALLIEMRVSKTNYSPEDIHQTILDALKQQKSEIDDVFSDTLGAGYTGAVLEIDGDLDQSMLAPSSSLPTSSENTATMSTVDGNSGGNRRTIALILSILFCLLFVVSCSVLVVWHRKQNLRSYKMTAPDFRMSRERKKRRRKHHRSHRSSRRDKTSRSSRNKSSRRSREPLMIANHPYVDEEQNKMDERLMLGYAPHNQQISQQQQYPVQQQYPQNQQSTGGGQLMLEYAPQSLQHIIKQEEEDRGYDGGKSSFFESKAEFYNSMDASGGLKNGIDPEEAFVDSDNVLGLLYYDGASSGEEDAKSASRRYSRRSSTASSRKSRTSRRRRPSHASGKSRSSTSHTMASKSSRSRQSRRAEPLLLNQVKESDEMEYHREVDFNGIHHQEPTHHHLSPPQVDIISVETNSNDGDSYQP